MTKTARFFIKKRIGGGHKLRGFTLRSVKKKQVANKISCYCGLIDFVLTQLLGHALVKNTAMKKLVLFSIFSLLAQGHLQATVFYVFKNAPNPGNGSTWNTAFTDIAPCIEAANINDTVWVGAGVYFISAALNIKSGMKIFGGFSGTEIFLSERDFLTNKSILNGSNSKILYFENTDSTTLVDGFTMINGKTNLDPNFDCFQFGPPYFYCMGGAAYIYSDDVSKPSFANFKNCIFKKNIARYGGAIGLFLDKGDGGLTIENCEFDANNSVEDAGAISCTLGKECTGNILISDSYFHLNINGYWGTGALASYQFSEKSKIALVRCLFEANSTYLGVGGVSNSSNGKQSFEISDCWFVGNNAGDNKFQPGTGGAIGGGYYNIDRCYFFNNRAFEGGAFWGGRSEIKNSLLVNNQVTDEGGGIRSGGKTKVVNSTFIGNSASVGGAFFGGYNTDTIINNIFWGNRADSVGDLFYVPLLTYNPYLKGNYFGVDSCQDIIRNIYNQAVIKECDTMNLIGRDLRFRDSLHHDFRLPICSRTTNAGFDYPIQGPDLLHNPRIFGGKIDIGAIENQDSAILPHATVVDAILPNGQNGSITIDSISGGWPPYSVLWDSGDTTWQTQNLGTGLHNLSIIDSAGCNSVHSFSIKAIVSVVEQTPLGRFRIVPNPIFELAEIEFEVMPNEGFSLMVFSTYGRKLKEVQFDQKPFFFNRVGLPSGVYLFEMVGKAGQKWSSGKLMVR